MNILNQQAPLFVWPTQLCLGATLTTYVLSLITGNVSQVDRIWTFLPTLYTAYYALLPLWPRTQQTALLPYTPETVHESYVATFSPRALLMLALVVSRLCFRCKLCLMGSNPGYLDVQVLDDSYLFAWPFSRAACRLSYNALRRGFFRL